MHYLGKAIRLDPELANAYYYRGELFLICGENIRGLADLKKAHQLTQDSELIELIKNKIKELECRDKK